jgi:hypothetical protein
MTPLLGFLYRKEGTEPRGAIFCQYLGLVETIGHKFLDNQNGCWLFSCIALAKSAKLLPIEQTIVDPEVATVFVMDLWSSDIQHQAQNLILKISANVKTSKSKTHDNPNDDDDTSTSECHNSNGQNMSDDQ